MITKKLFTELIENAKEYNRELDRWNNFGIELFELPISELSWKFLDISLSIMFYNDGIDWINWWLFEKPGILGDKPNEAYDKEGKIIPTDTIDDLWELVKDYRK